MQTSHVTNTHSKFRACSRVRQLLSVMFEVGDASMGRWLHDLFPREDYVAYWSLCDRLQTRALRDGLGVLSPCARVILLAERDDVGMAKSGWYSLVYWDDYDLMDMIPALEAVGAAVNAQVLRELAVLFPGGTIPPSTKERVHQYHTQVMDLEEQLEKLDERLRTANEDIVRLTEQFALAHRAELREEEVEPDPAPDPRRIR
jgi:hypothetical protein